jgi:hypothetical protein
MLIIIVAGFALLGVSWFTGRWFAIFLAIWFAVAAINMWIGVTHAGYTVREELPIFLVIFLLPACVAAFLWWRLPR